MFKINGVLFNVLFLQISPPTLVLSERELEAYIESENVEELSKFTIPLIIENQESTKDKKGVSSKLSHVIVNSKFYGEYIASSVVYKSFLVHITIGLLNEKFNVSIDSSDYVILKNKQFQLPDNQNTFNKLLRDTLVEANTETNNNKMEVLDNAKVLDNEPENSADSNSNVRMSLDCKNDLLEVAIKLNDEVSFEDLALLLNDDRIMIRHKDQVLNDFHTSVPMNADQASALFKDNVLRIKCPVFL